MSCCDKTSCCTTPAPTTTKPCCDPSSSSCCVAPPKTSASTSSCCATSSATSTASSGSSCCGVDPEYLKERVREDYARVATSSADNADHVATKFGYTLAELASIPEGANLGVSCGNPLAISNVVAGEVVVDLGSGGGLDCFLAATKVGPSGKVYGIDTTPAMLSRARENALKRNITNVEFVKGDIEAIPLPDAVADLVISNCVINLVPNKQKAFAEIFRILKPGGRLAISDIVLKTVIPEELKRDIALYSACLSGAMDLSAVPHLLESAGFRGVLVKEAQVDLNAYKELGVSNSGCCASIPDSSHPVAAAPDAVLPLPPSVQDIDFNHYATSAKIFALK